MVDSPLLSYIDVHHANFLPPSLTTWEARDIGPRYTAANELAPVRDESIERVSLALREQKHIPVEGNKFQIQAAKQAVAEDEQGAKMVTRKKLTAEQFLFGTRSSAQPQPAQAEDRTPPPPSGHGKKRQRLVDQQTEVPTSVVLKTPFHVSTGVVIREPMGDFRPTPQTGTNVVSSSQLEAVWQPTFKLEDGPLPTSASASAWFHGHGKGGASCIEFGIGSFVARGLKIFFCGDR